MSNQDKRAERRKQEDAAFNKMLLWLGVCVVLECVTLLLRRLYFKFTLSDFGLGAAMGINNFFMVFRYAGVVLSAAGIIWLIASVRKGKKGKALRLPAVVTGVLVWLTAAALLTYGQKDLGMTLLMALPVVLAVLALVFYLYQREFFYNAILCAVGITALWVFKQIYSGHPKAVYLGFAAVWVFLALAAFGTYQLKKKDGVAFGFRVLPTGANYLPIWVTCLALAVALAVTLVAGAASAYYIMFAVIGWLFCLAVYYTVKLM